MPQRILFTEKINDISGMASDCWRQFAVKEKKGVRIMKRKQKRVLALLLACMMMYIPAAQAMAASVYEVTSDELAGAVLFPGDSLTGIAEGTVITKTNGDQTTADGSGVWKNESESKAVTASYTAGTDAVVSAAEDGTEVVEAEAVPASIQLTLAGYVLTVVEGTSETALTDGTGTTENHYEFSDEEKAALEEENISKDIAYYPEGESVKIKAADPAEGYVFAGWTVEAADDVTVTIEDASSQETTFVMPNGKVTVTATYTQETEAAAVETEDTEAAAATEATEAAEAAETTEATEATEATAATDSNEIVVVDVTEETTAETTAETAAETDAVDAGIAVTADITYATLTVNYDTGAEAYAKTDSVTYAAGDAVTVTAETLDGYTFSGWYVSSLNVTLDDLTAQTVSFTMPETDVTILATYTAAQTETTAETMAETTAETTAADTVDDDGIMIVTDDSGAATVAEPATTAYTYTLTKKSVSGDTELAAAETQIASEDVTGTETPAGVTFTVTATETITVSDVTYEFSSWSVAADTATVSVADAAALETTVTVTEPATTDTAVTVQANYTEVAKYTVTVDGTALTDTYVSGATVTITPPAATVTGTAFASWTIVTASDNKTVEYTDNGDGTYSFTMPADNVTVSSVFDEVPYTVTVVSGTTGTSGATAATYYYGESVSIAAAAAPEGQTFDHWTSTGTTEVTFTNASSATTTFTMPAGDVEVTAVYVNEPDTYTVKVSNGLIDGTYTENTYEEGTSITVTANVESGQEFSGWTVNDGAYDLGDSASTSTITVTVDQDLTFVANYTGVKYSVMVTNGSADYTQTTAGTTVTITADAPETGYEFDSWTVGTQNVTLANASKSTTTFTMPSADVSVTANYKKVQYSVTVENGNANATYFYYGDTVTISSNYPASGKVFSAWTATSGNVTFTDASKASTTFTMPASNVTISATYEDAPTGADNYISGIEQGGSYVANEKLTFTPVGAGMDITDPNPGDVRYVPTGYTIGNVSNTWSSAPYETSMSIKKTGEYTLTVTFARQVYDGSSWVADGTTTTTSVTFNIVESLESVQTGDDTPIMQVVAIAVVACLIFIVLLVVFIRRRKRDDE